MPTPEPFSPPSAFDTGSNVFLKIRALEGWVACIFDESPVGIVRTDLQLRLKYANKKAMEICGISSWENINILDLVPNSETVELLKEKLANRQRGLSEEYEVEVLRKSDGRRIPIKIT